MTKKEWDKIKQIRIEVVEDNHSYSYPIRCPRWLYWVLERLEISSNK